MITGEGLQFIQQQLVPRTAQAPVAGCCCAERQRYPLSLLESTRPDWPHALEDTPRRCHGRMHLVMQQHWMSSSFKDAMSPQPDCRRTITTSPCNRQAFLEL